MESLWQSSNFWSALFGAIVGGFFVLIGAFLSFCYDSKKEEKQKMESIDIFFNGIYYEIESFWKLDMVKSAIQKLNAISEDDKYLDKEIERRMQSANNHGLDKLMTDILPKNVITELFYIRREEYFLIYNNNVNLIGKIKDKELIRLIINVYNKIKGLLDLFDINNDYRRKYIYFFRAMLGGSRNRLDKSELLIYMQLLRKNAIILKKSYKGAEEAKNVLFEKLKPYINNYGNIKKRTKIN